MMFLRFFLFITIVLQVGCSEDSDEFYDDSFILLKTIPLPAELDENSGMILLNGKLIMHNDGGNDAVLYEVEPASGKIVRRIRMQRVQNVDMEDIAQDEDFIYVGDFGNNNNDRKDLMIHKIRKEDFLANNTVNTEVIRFSYQEQTDYNRNERQTNFDAEALVCLDDALLLFTKRWLDNKTALYEIPKEPGTYRLRQKALFNVKGLITGAAFDSIDEDIVLSGYSSFIPLLVKLDEFELDSPESTELTRTNVGVKGSSQTEGIVLLEDGSFYLSAEKSGGNPPVLYYFTSNE